MAGKIIVCETAKFKASGELEAFAAFRQVEFERIDCAQGFAALQSSLGASGATKPRLVLASSEFEANAEFQNALEAAQLVERCAWVDVGSAAAKASDKIFSRLFPQDLVQPVMIQLLYAAYDPERPAGIKSFLKEGSTIYTQSITSTQGIGALLDPCNTLGRDNLSTAQAMNFWSTLNALVAEAVASLQAKASEGARVELQVGADADIVCASARFPFAFTSLQPLYERVIHRKNVTMSPWLIAREASTFSEIRAYEENKSVEFAIVFARKEFTQSATRPILIRQIAQLPQEDARKTANYRFQPFAGLGKKKKSGAFKNNISERLAELGPKAEAKGDDQVLNATASNRDKSGELYESKIQSLQSALAQRDELIAKLNKEIAETVDPLRRGAVSGVIDKQKEALQQNVKRLEETLKASEGREKELMSMVDKAIQQKERFMKEVKALEAKLEQASSGNNSLVVKLQRQLDEANKQKAALSKKISEMTDTTSKKAS